MRTSLQQPLSDQPNAILIVSKFTIPDFPDLSLQPHRQMFKSHFKYNKSAPFNYKINNNVNLIPLLN